MTMNPFTPQEPNPPPPQERGDVLGLSLIAVLAALMVAALRAEGPAKSIFMGLALIAWGGMFLASYFFSHKTFFLLGLRWFCVTLSYPSTPRMAFFYAAVMGAMGLASILAGLGVV